MGTLQRRLPDNEQIRAFGGDLLPATLGETLGAVAGDPLLRPTELLGRQSEIFEAAGQTLRRRPGRAGGRVIEPSDQTGLSPLVDPQALNEEFGELGLRFDKPTRRKVAELMAEGKREERIRADVVVRGPSGVLPTALQFGAAFAGSILDPLNIAAGFVPVVGQARLAGLTLRLGVNRARFTAGLIEGAVGNAAIEPFVGGLARQQQLDYTMVDALINVTIGGILGGGLHLGAGKISDFIARRRPATIESAQRTAVQQMAQGRLIDVMPVMVADFGLTRRERLRSSAAAIRSVDGVEISAGNLGERLAAEQTFGPSRTETLAANKFGDRVNVIQDAQGDTAVVFDGTRVADAQGHITTIKTEDGIKIKTVRVGKKFRRQAVATELYERLFLEGERRGVDILSDEAIAPAATKVWQALKKKGHNITQEPGATITPKGAAMNMGKSVFRFSPTEKPALPQPPALRAIEDAAARSGRPELLERAGREGAAERESAVLPLTSERVKEAADLPAALADDAAIDGEIEFNQGLVDELVAAELITAAGQTRLDKIAAIEAEAQVQSKAYKAGAICMGRQS